MYEDDNESVGVVCAGVGQAYDQSIYSQSIAWLT